jgi:integrase
VKVAQETHGEFRWDLLILMALTTGMRRGELLNLTWRDIDFEAGHILVCPKENSVTTWEWQIKDSDRRTLAVPEEIMVMLAEHQNLQHEGNPYVFIPPHRYDHILRLRQEGKWNYSCTRLKLIQNFNRYFSLLLQRAGISRGQFHDLRRTTLTMWLRHVLSEFDVMTLAGHASFTTTRNFYLAVADDLGERVRQTPVRAYSDLLRAPFFARNEKSCQS